MRAPGSTTADACTPWLGARRDWVDVEFNAQAREPERGEDTDSYRASVLWTHRFWGAPPDPRRRWGATLYGEKGTLHASVWGYDFAPLDGTPAVHREVRLELEEFPEDRSEKDLEHFAAPAIRRHMKDLLACRETRQRPVADDS